jgi:hypothetical protein
MKRVIDTAGNHYEIPDELLEDKEIPEGIILANDGAVYRFPQAELEHYRISESNVTGIEEKLVLIRKLTPDTPPQEEPRDICDTLQAIITWCRTGGV